jgi:hypothetical protein
VLPQVPVHPAHRIAQALVFMPPFLKDRYAILSYPDLFGCHCVT